MNRYKSAPARSIDTRFVLRMLLVVGILAFAGLGFVFIKIQQHKLGEQTRMIEARISELQAYNHVLRSELSSLTSHARIREAMVAGQIALVAISDQYIARLNLPEISPRDLATQTASAMPVPIVP